MNFKKDCQFCDGRKVLQHTIFETENFKILSNIGPLIEGHILLITKNHESCMGKLNREIFEEFKVLYSKLLIFMYDVYNAKITVFEHGNIHQSILHAHMHFLPICDELSIDDIISNTNDYRQINSIDRIQNEFASNSRYLYLEIDDGKYLVNTEIGYTGFFRKKIADMLHLSERASWFNVITNQSISKDVEEEVKSLEMKWFDYKDKFNSLNPLYSK